MINIFEREQLQAFIAKLQPDALPLWGKMSAQHMIEHLSQTVIASTGKIQIKLHSSQEDAEARKQKLIYGDLQLSPGIKHPMLGDEPPPLIHHNFADAVASLYSDLNYFDEYYLANAGIKNMHPRLGELNRNEWEVFHNKHFFHHFKQFAIV